MRKRHRKNKNVIEKTKTSSKKQKRHRKNKNVIEKIAINKKKYRLQKMKKRKSQNSQPFFLVRMSHESAPQQVSSPVRTIPVRLPSSQPSSGQPSSPPSQLQAALQSSPRRRPAQRLDGKSFVPTKISLFIPLLMVGLSTSRPN
jgi:hypothetical protein